MRTLVSVLLAISVCACDDGTPKPTESAQLKSDWAFPIKIGSSEDEAAKFVRMCDKGYQSQYGAKTTQFECGEPRLRYVVDGASGEITQFNFFLAGSDMGPGMNSSLWRGFPSPPVVHAETVAFGLVPSDIVDVTDVLEKLGPPCYVSGRPTGRELALASSWLVGVRMLSPVFGETGSGWVWRKDGIFIVFRSKGGQPQFLHFRRAKDPDC